MVKPVESLDRILGITRNGVTCCKTCTHLGPPVKGRLGCPFYPGELTEVLWVGEKQITSKKEPWCSDYINWSV